MAVCCCSLAGTAACNHCSQNPFATDVWMNKIVTVDHAAWEKIIDAKPLTNADRIRAMTDEELAELFANDNCGYCRIHDFCFGKGCAINCEDVWLDWLKQEATE